MDVLDTVDQIKVKSASFSLTKSLLADNIVKELSLIAILHDEI